MRRSLVRSLTGSPFHWLGLAEAAPPVMIAAVDDLNRIRQGVLAALPRDLDRLLPPPALLPVSAASRTELERFLRLMADYPSRPGKGLRGQLLLLSARAHGAEPCSPGEAGAVVLAEALELFQNWVLVHDDIEDDSDERRGLPALHQQTGMPVALNVGDAMHVAMWDHLRALPPLETYPQGAVLEEFALMIMRTAAGQHLDLAWVEGGRFDVSEADYVTMVSLKTAYYTVVAPLRLGALSAGAAPAELLEAAGLDLGVAFQIRDDVLNLQAGAELGKEFAGDLYEGKRTLVLAHLLGHVSERDRQRVISLLDRPRRSKQPREMAEVLELMQRYGSIAYAQGVAEERLQRGVARLEEALAHAPRRPAVEQILGLVGDLAARPN